MPAPLVCKKLSFQVDAGLLVEDMADMACEVEGNGLAMSQSSDFCAGHVHGGNNQNNILTQCGNVQVDGGTHHFGNVDLTGDTGIDAKIDVSEMMGSSVHLHINAMGRDVVVVVSTMNMTGAEVAALNMGTAVKCSFPGNCCHVFNKETGINLEA